MHAYPTSDGCAIVGAAFYNPKTVQFPADFVGDYFFGDYCGGFIKRLDGTSPKGFATGIEARSTSTSRRTARCITWSAAAVAGCSR